MSKRATNLQAPDTAERVKHPAWCVQPLPHDPDDCAGEQRAVAATGQPASSDFVDGIAFPAVVLCLSPARRMPLPGIFLEVLPLETVNTVLRPEEARQLAAELVTLADVAEGVAR